MTKTERANERFRAGNFYFCAELVIDGACSRRFSALISLLSQPVNLLLILVS